MNEEEIDSFIQYLWTQYQTDADDVNGIITSLLMEVRAKMIIIAYGTKSNSIAKKQK